MFSMAGVRFTLTGLFLVVTLSAVWLSAGRAFGFLTVTLFIMTPVPPVLYLTVVRSFMADHANDCSNSWTISNVGLSIGLILAICVSVVLLGFAFAHMNVPGPLLRIGDETREGTW